MYISHVTELSTQGAKVVLQGAIEKAEQLGVPQCVAIVDRGGNLLVFERMQGAKILSQFSAIQKFHLDRQQGSYPQSWRWALPWQPEPALLRSQAVSRSSLTAMWWARSAWGQEAMRKILKWLKPGLPPSKPRSQVNDICSTRLSAVAQKLIKVTFR